MNNLVWGKTPLLHGLKPYQRLFSFSLCYSLSRVFPYMKEFEIELYGDYILVRRDKF